MLVAAEEPFTLYRATNITHVKISYGEVHVEKCARLLLSTVRDAADDAAILAFREAGVSMGLKRLFDDASSLRTIFVVFTRLPGFNSFALQQKIRRNAGINIFRALKLLINMQDEVSHTFVQFSSAKTRRHLPAVSLRCAIVGGMRPETQAILLLTRCFVLRYQARPRDQTRALRLDNGRCITATSPVQNKPCKTCVEAGGNKDLGILS